MTGREFAAVLQKEIGISSVAKTYKMVKSFWEAVEMSMESDRKLIFKGYGRFYLTEISERKCTTRIQTGEKRSVAIPRHNKLKFNQGKYFKDMIEERYYREGERWIKKDF